MKKSFFYVLMTGLMIFLSGCKEETDVYDLLERMRIADTAYYEGTVTMSAHLIADDSSISSGTITQYLDYQNGKEIIMSSYEVFDMDEPHKSSTYAYRDATGLYYRGLAYNFDEDENIFTEGQESFYYYEIDDLDYQLFSNMFPPRLKPNFTDLDRESYEASYTYMDSTYSITVRVTTSQLELMDPDFSVLGFDNDPIFEFKIILDHELTVLSIELYTIEGAQTNDAYLGMLHLKGTYKTESHTFPNEDVLRDHREKALKTFR